MQAVGEAVQELHAKDWIHADVKPDNVLIDWYQDSDNDKVVTDIALVDFDIACKLKVGETRITPHALPTIYPLGLLYLCALGAGEILILKNYQELLKARVTPEQEMVTKHFSYFGPLPENLYQQIRDEKWRSALRSASAMAEAEVAERSIVRFKVWGEELGEAAVDMLQRMLSLDPSARPTIDQLMAHPFWKELES